MFLILMDYKLTLLWLKLFYLIWVLHNILSPHFPSSIIVVSVYYSSYFIYKLQSVLYLENYSAGGVTFCCHYSVYNPQNLAERSWFSELRRYTNSKRGILTIFLDVLEQPARYFEICMYI